MNLDHVLTVIKAKNWEVSSPLVQHWCNKANDALLLYESDDVMNFKRLEILHYLTQEQLQHGNVEFNPDQLFMQQCYPTQGRKLTLQSFETTFNTRIKGLKCPNCQKRNATTLERQTRSMDEPSSYYSHCNDCNHQWRSG
jgi:DNA-directed RNA polymerase subunit M/transcription elongation factor TFIIS